MPRSTQLELLAERGDPGAAPSPDALLARARESGEPQLIACALPAAALLLLAQGQEERALELLVELEQAPAAREANFAESLPGLVRGALALGDRELASRLAEGMEPVVPMHGSRALATVRALLAEAGGDTPGAADLHAEAAERWRTFGDVPELAYAPANSSPRSASSRRSPRPRRSSARAKPPPCSEHARGQRDPGANASGVSLFTRKPLAVPSPEDALPGRDTPVLVPGTHLVLGHADRPALPGGHGARDLRHGVLLGRG